MDVSIVFVMSRYQETPRQKQDWLKGQPLPSSPGRKCSPRGARGGWCGCHHNPDRDKLMKTGQDGYKIVIQQKRPDRWTNLCVLVGTGILEA